MKYREIEEITREEAEKILEGSDIGKICNALVDLTNHEDDWRWMQDKCLELAEHSNLSVAGVAITCLGDIARIHKKLDKEKVVERLQKLQENPKLAGRIEDALEDVSIYIKS